MSRPSETFFCVPNSTQFVKPIDVLLGEKRRINNDWNALLAFKGGVTITASTWASEGRNVSPGTNTNTGGITSTLLTPGSGLGLDGIKNTITLSNGEKLVRKWRVNVTDPLNEFISTGGGHLRAFQIIMDEYDSSDFGGTVPIQVDLTESANGEMFSVYLDGVLQSADNYILPNYPSETLRLAAGVDRSMFQKLTVIYSY